MLDRRDGSGGHSRRPERQTRASLLHLGLGALIGLATLTKVVAAAVLPALVIVYLMHRASPRRRRALGPGRQRSGSSSVTGLVVRSATWRCTGISPAVEVWRDWESPSLRLRIHGARVTSRPGLSSIVGYLYAPVEYYRNVLKAPGPVPRRQPCSCSSSPSGWSGRFTARHLRGARRSPERRADPGRVLLVAVPLVTLGAWVGYDVAIWNVPVRLAFHAATMAAVLLAVATRGRLGGLACGANLVIFLAMDIWLVLAVAGVSVPALNPLG